MIEFYDIYTFLNNNFYLIIFEINITLQVNFFRHFIYSQQQEALGTPSPWILLRSDVHNNGSSIYLSKEGACARALRFMMKCFVSSISRTFVTKWKDLKIFIWIADLFVHNLICNISYWMTVFMKSLCGFWCSC